MLVLLIIFMVAAPMLQRGVEVNLPVARQTQKMTEERMYITVPLSFRKDARCSSDEEAVSIEFLAERTRQAMLGKEQKEVFLRGDGEVQLQELMDVFDQSEGRRHRARRHRRAAAAREGRDRWTRSPQSSSIARSEHRAADAMVGAASVAAHVALVAAVVLAPAWLRRRCRASRNRS